MNNLRKALKKTTLIFFKESTLRREISIDGKSRSFINDTPVNLTILKQIGEKLIDIHSQHATQEINNADFQLLMVDSLSNHNNLLLDYRTGYKELRKDSALLKKLISEANEAKSKQDYEQFLFNELEQANLQANEQEDLEAELEKLTHAETIKRALLNANALLSEAEPSAILILKEAQIQLQTVEKFDSSINILYERLKSSIIEIKDVADEISTIENNTTHNAERLDTINQRLDLLYSLQQKHRVDSNEELIAIKNQLEHNLNQLLSSDEQIEKLSKQIESLKTELTNQAKELSQNRTKAIKLVEI